MKAKQRSWSENEQNKKMVVSLEGRGEKSFSMLGTRADITSQLRARYMLGTQGARCNFSGPAGLISLSPIGVQSRSDSFSEAEARPDLHPEEPCMVSDRPPNG